MDRKHVQRAIVIWANGDSDVQRDCEDCKDLNCRHPTHKEASYHEIKKGNKVKSQRSDGIRIDKNGAYSLENECD